MFSFITILLLRVLRLPLFALKKLCRLSHNNKLNSNLSLWNNQALEFQIMKALIQVHGMCSQVQCSNVITKFIFVVFIN